ncbi:Kazal-type serine protease inhibitor domain-containing protein [Phyllobacterium phragmitis]|uniref:Kazal-type serine protease inhibitor domain-containing protein n=1 Tax=Phyllobacterium phragmitis TaxID=2670329 RepID=UPI0038B26A4D
MSTGAGQLLAFVFILGAASACTVAPDHRPVPGRTTACTFENAPVCARRGNQLRTFTNACLAQSRGFQVVRRGPCRTSAGPVWNRPAACTREFAPVCAVRANVRRTFDNSCLARASGFRPVRPGRCR